MDKPSNGNDFQIEHARLITESHQRLLQRPLIEPTDYTSLGRALFEADFVVVSHNTDPDPLFNYGNRKALALFEFAWHEFVRLPSRYSAEPLNRQAREALLQAVGQNGFIDHYSGVRIAKSGKRFRIERATVWNLTDRNGRYRGQAACFKYWTVLE